jgi:5-methyltetrahydrofolate--homocysteine methyltransferase
MMLDHLRRSVVRGDTGEVRRLVAQTLAEGVPPATVLEQGLVSAMTEVGERFECGEFYIPEMLVAARAMKAGLELLRPELSRARIPLAGRVVIGSVEGDLHDIGKNLVGIMLEGAGFDVVDLGTNVAAERFVAAARDGADLVGISALLTTTMTRIPHVIQALAAAGLRRRVSVIIGGAHVNQAFATEAGADGYAPDASQAAVLARRLLDHRSGAARR